MADEIQMTPEQITELKAQAEKAKLLEEEVVKLRSKDMNFENLRKAKEEEEKKVKEVKNEKSELEKKVEEKMTAMEIQQRTWREALVKEKKDSYLNELCGSDVEFRKKVEYEMTQLVGEEDTEERLKGKISRAFTLVKGAMPEASMFGKISSSSGAGYKPSAPRFTDSEDGKGVLKKIAPNVDFSKVKTGGNYFDNL